MRKLKLDLDDLAVETFETTRPDDGEGTVFANQSAVCGTGVPCRLTRGGSICNSCITCWTYCTYCLTICQTCESCWTLCTCFTRRDQTCHPLCTQPRVLCG